MSAISACKSDSVSLSPPGAADCELATTTSGGAKEVARVRVDSGLRVRENSIDFAVFLADYVHEERVGGLYQSLEFMHTLLLVRIGVQKVHLHCAL